MEAEPERSLPGKAVKKTGLWMELESDDIGSAHSASCDPITLFYRLGHLVKCSYR